MRVRTHCSSNFFIRKFNCLKDDETLEIAFNNTRIRKRTNVPRTFCMNQMCALYIYEQKKLYV